MSRHCFGLDTVNSVNYGFSVRRLMFNDSCAFIFKIDMRAKRLMHPIRYGKYTKMKFIENLNIEQFDELTVRSSSRPTRSLAQSVYCWTVKLFRVVGPVDGGDMVADGGDEGHRHKMIQFFVVWTTNGFVWKLFVWKIDWNFCPSNETSIHRRAHYLRQPSRFQQSFSHLFTHCMFH